MRSDSKIEWDKGIENFVNKKENTLCLRQKPNLVRFVNGFAKEIGLMDWSVDANDQYSGGRVIVVKNYNTDLHIELLNEGKKANADPYDMLFLVPNDDVKNGQFIKYELYNQNKILLFDGTNPDNKTYFSLDNSLCRLYNMNPVEVLKVGLLFAMTLIS